MNNVVSCISPKPDRKNCPYLEFCPARLTDKTITGCGVPLYRAGIIPYDAVMVEHTVKENNDDKV